MAIVIKEIVVKTTVEQMKRLGQEVQASPEVFISPEVLERLKEEIWNELERRGRIESKRKER